MSDFVPVDYPNYDSEPVPDSIPGGGMPNSRDAIFKHREAVLNAEVRRGVEVADEQRRPTPTPVRHAAPAPQPPVNPVLYQRALAGDPQAQVHLQQELRHRAVMTVGSEYPDVFENPTRARLAAICANDIWQRDAAMGLRRPDLDVIRESAQAARRELAPRRSARAKQR